MTRWHPWRAIRARRDIEVTWEPLPKRRLGESLGTDMKIAPGLLQVERRMVATHEYVHICRGDSGTCASDWHKGRQEREVRRISARLCIALDELVDALLWSSNEHEVAEALWVTVPVLRDYLKSLTQAENDYVTGRLLEAESWIGR